MKLIKGEKEILKVIENSKNSELLINNENILKSIVMQKEVLPRIDQRKTSRKSSLFRADTATALCSLMNSK